jgi:hypothetical protein
MKRVFQFIRKLGDSLFSQAKRFGKERGRILVFTFALATIASGAIVMDISRCLDNKHSRRGFITLVSSSDRAARSLREKWKSETCLSAQIKPRGRSQLANAEHASHTVIERAKLSLAYDFLFIGCYTVFFLCSIAMLRGRHAVTVTKFHLVACVILMITDVSENVLLLLFLGGQNSPMWVLEILTISKFLMFVWLFVGYILFWSRAILDFSRYFQDVFGYLWRNRVTVCSLVILYLVIWKTDQGQDLLISLSAGGVALYLFYGLLFVLAALNWYLPRYYIDDSFRRNEPAANSRRIFPPYANGDWHYTSDGKEKEIPRIFGVLTFLIPCFGILQAFDSQGTPYLLDFLSPISLLLITTIFFGWLQHNNLIRTFIEFLFGKRDEEKTKALPFKAIFGFPIAIIFIIAFLSPDEGLSSMAIVSMNLFALTWIFLVIVTAFDEKAMFPWMEKYNSNAARIVLWSGGLVSVLFVIISSFPYLVSGQWASRFVTLPVLLGGIIFYTMLFWLLITLGKQWRFNIGATLAIVIIAWAYYRENTFHDIRRIEHVPYEALEPLTSYANRWVDVRRDSIMAFSGESYPVFLVNTYGGGIRAAAWTSIVVTHLDKETSYKFQDHLFSYSGASGGTVGASVMCALKKSGQHKQVTMNDIQQFYKNDFLTPVIVGLVGRDLFLSLLGQSWAEDRAQLQDQLWEGHLSQYDKGIYSQEFSSLWSDNDSTSRYFIPLLFSNASQVEDGLKAILAPVVIDSAIFPQTIDVRKKLGNSSVPFSTGALLSARFPFLNPAGRLDSINHLLDGGIKENSGAETSYDLYQLLNRIKINRKGDHAWDKIKFYFISLNNSTPSDPSPISSSFAAFTAPISAMVNNGFGYATRADSINRTLFKHLGQYIQISPCLDTVTCGVQKGIKPVLPLGWQISDCALQRLVGSIGAECNKENVDRIKQLLQNK